MRELPIIFNDEMVRSIIRGDKTVTRRPVMPGGGPVHAGRYGNGWRELRDGWAWCEGDAVLGGVYRCPYGEPGDVLYVREAWGLHRWFDHTDWLRGSVRGLSEGYLRSEYALAYRSDVDSDGAYWRPSILMPRWASRTFLRVTSVRVERLQDITEEQAMREGVPNSDDYPLSFPACRECGGEGVHEAFMLDSFGAIEVDCRACASATGRLRSIWDSIYVTRGLGWSANPWVWAIEFERAEVSR